MTVYVCSSCLVGKREGTNKLDTTNDGEQWIGLRLSLVSPSVFEPERDPPVKPGGSDLRLQVVVSSAVLPDLGGLKGRLLSK
jgi:hypothetical protein